MKKTQPQAAPKKAGRPQTAEADKKRLRPVYLTDQVHAELIAGGGVSPVINRLLRDAGFGKKSSQTKI